MKQLIEKDALVAEIERRRDLHYKYYIKNGAGSIAECKYDEDREILSFLDTLEVKEPKEIDFEKELLSDPCQVKDLTLCVNIAKKYYGKGYFDGHIHDGDRIVHVDGRKVNVSRFRRVAKPLEEPVSEDLEEAATEYVVKEAAKDITGNWTTDDILNAFKAGAKWQKEQFEKNRLAHCYALSEEQAELEQGFYDQHFDKYNRIPTFLDAIEYGMKLHKEQMLKGANDVMVKNLDSLSYLDCIAKLGCVDKDIVKVIIIKNKD